MKILRLLPVAAIACLMASCQNGGGSSLGENASQTDSLMYYLGQMNGADYLREANRDTTLMEASEKQAYLSGVRAGLAALKEGNEAYNRGVMLGMNMASQMMGFSEHMGVEINKNTYISSLSATVMADTLPNMNEVQTNFRQVMQNIEQGKQERDKAASQESLKKVAENSGLPKISDDLYGKATDAGEGAKLAENDEVTVVAKITTESGEAVGYPVTPQGQIGNKRSFPAEVISEAMKTLKSGQTGEFLTTAHALMGSRAQQLGLEPTDVLKMTLTPTLVPATEEEKPANPAN